MIKRLAYVPQFDMQHLRAFDERLSTLPGSWTTIGRSFVHAGAPGVIRLQWIIPDAPWCNEHGFLAFLDQRIHRLLLRAFLQRDPLKPDTHESAGNDGTSETDRPSDHRRTWKMEHLLQKMGGNTHRTVLQQALCFLEQQGYVTSPQTGAWMGSALLQNIENFGPTFEWMVQAHLQQQHQAVTRRCVSFQEWQAAHLNDLDVVAFIDRQVIMVECKSGPDVTFDHLARFVRRARAFPADIALLLIDTVSPQKITNMLQSLNVLLERAVAAVEHTSLHKGSQVMHVAENLYVANTAGGIAASLDGVLHMSTSRHTSHDIHL